MTKASGFMSLRARSNRAKLSGQEATRARRQCAALKRKNVDCEQRLQVSESRRRSTEQELQRAKQDQKSIIDLIGGIGITIKPEPLWGQKRFALMVTFAPDMIINPFIRSGSEIGDFNRYLHYVTMDLARKIQETVLKEFDKATGLSP